ncbi:hypothetical protein HK405_001229, partial [Cladochytrium tenue]
LERTRRDRAKLEESVRELVARLQDLGVSHTAPARAANFATAAAASAATAATSSTTASSSDASSVASDPLDRDSSPSRASIPPSSPAARILIAPHSPVLVGAAKDVGTAAARSGARRGGSAPRMRPIQVHTVTLLPPQTQRRPAAAAGGAADEQALAPLPSPLGQLIPGANSTVKQLMAWIEAAGRAASREEQPPKESGTPATAAKLDLAGDELRGVPPIKPLAALAALASAATRRRRTPGAAGARRAVVRSAAIPTTPISTVTADGVNGDDEIEASLHELAARVARALNRAESSAGAAPAPELGILARLLVIAIMLLERSRRRVAAPVTTAAAVAAAGTDTDADTIGVPSAVASLVEEDGEERERHIAAADGAVAEGDLRGAPA